MMMLSSLEDPEVVDKIVDKIVSNMAIEFNEKTHF